jgi:hypothetical protein
MLGPPQLEPGDARRLDGKRNGREIVHGESLRRTSGDWAECIRCRLMHDSREDVE